MELVFTKLYDFFLLLGIHDTMNMNSLIKKLIPTFLQQFVLHEKVLKICQTNS